MNGFEQFLADLDGREQSWTGSGRLQWPWTDLCALVRRFESSTNHVIFFAICICDYGFFGHTQLRRSFSVMTWPTRP